MNGNSPEKIKKVKNLIIGAGITGLSTAFHLKDKNYLLIEKEKRPGGLCRSEKQGGFTYDYTGHLLHIKNEYVKKLIFKLLSGNIASRARNAAIYSNNVFTRYPFQANLYGLPQKIIAECIESFIKSKLTTPYSLLPTPCFYDWCLQTFGEGISKYFMIPYNEKLWQTDTRELTTRWMGRYVPQPSLEEVIRGAYNDNKKLFGYNANFYYPMRGGIQTLIDGISKKVENIETSVNVKSIDIKKKIVLTDKGVYGYKNLVSTIPLPVLVSLIKNLPADVKKSAWKLKWTSVLDINIGISRAETAGRHWIYFPENKYVFYRVGYYNNFSKGLCPKNTFSMYVEVAYPPDSPARQLSGERRAGIDGKTNKENVFKKAVSDLKKAGILKSNDKIISKCLLDIPYAYVVYDKNKEPAFEKISGFLKKHSVRTTGRYGGWKYSTMEDAILEGMETAKLLK